MNDNAPTFSGPTLFDPPVFGFGVAVAAGDLNGDGLPDLLQSNQPGNAGFPDPNVPIDPAFLGIFLGLPDGGLAPPTAVPDNHFVAIPFDPDGGAALAAIGFADAGQDLIDLYTVEGVRVGGSTLFDPTRQLEVPARQLAVADTDQDGHPDLVVCERSQIEVFSGPDLKLRRAVPPDLSMVFNCAGVAAADLNQDGLPDLVVLVGPPGSRSLLVMLAEGPPGSYSSTNYPLTATATLLTLGVQDLNGDGLPDVVVTTGEALTVFLNEGGGKLGEGAFYATLYRRYVTNLSIADVNGDCIPDLLVSDASTCGDVTNEPAATISVFVNHGDGTFSAPADIGAGTLDTPGALTAFTPAGATLPSIATVSLCSGILETLQNLSPLPQ